MRVLFFGFLFCDEFYHNVYVKSKFNVPLASHTYNKELIDGLSKCDDVSLSVYNVPPIGSFPINSEHIYMKEYKWDENYTQLGYLNLPVIKFKSQENILYNKVKNEVKKYYDKEKISILIYNLSEPYLKVAKKIKKDYPDICVTLIQADAVLGKNDMEEYMTKRNIMRGNRLIELSKTVDKFVLFSKYLEEPLEIGKRPYLVSECIINPNTKKTEINNNHRKIFLYTGTLFPDYEIFEFCQAIAKNKNAEVWICGSGPESNKIEELSKVSDNVKFFGYVDKKTVEDLRDKCDFLFNSRKPTGTYTKYSFPSKTAEYMMSAKPVVMYKLEGVPDKYDEYLTYLDINKSFDEEIERILNLDYNELVKKAEQGRDFIIKTRNNVTVAKEIIEFIKK